MQEQTEIGNDIVIGVGACSDFCTEEKIEKRDKALNYQWLPIPDENGGVTATVTAYGAIRANSNQKELAWQFMKLLLDEESPNRRVAQVLGGRAKGIPLCELRGENTPFVPTALRFPGESDEALLQALFATSWTDATVKETLAEFEAQNTRYSDE